MKHQRCLALLMALVLFAGLLSGCAGIPSRPVTVVTNQGDRTADQAPETETGGGEDPSPAQEPEEKPVLLRENGKSYLEYDVLFQGEGVGDHPAFEALSLAKEALASIGITLNLIDTDDSAAMQEALSAGEQDLWAAAWPVNRDPELSRLYHSDSIPGGTEGGSNYYRISDPALDALLEEAQGSGSQAYRRTIYRRCLDLIMDWAVEIPDYQRRGAVIFNSAAVDTDTVTPDLTRYWDWTKEAESLKMKNGSGVLRVAAGTPGHHPDPFFAVSPFDADVVALTQLSTLTTDRQGAVVTDAIAGETRGYNGSEYRYTGPANISFAYDAASDTTTYTIRLREGITFADGSEATAEDLIFALYVLADPSYLGPKDLTAYHIQGLEDYRTQTTAETFERLSQLFERLYAAGPDASSGENAEASQLLWDLQEEIWLASILGIVDYAAYNYLSFAESTRYGGGFTKEEIEASQGLRTAFAMALWGYGTWDDSGLFRSVGGKTWNCRDGEYPEIRDFYAETYTAYKGDLKAFAEGEDANGSDLLTLLRRRFVREMAAKDPDTEHGVPRISGIRMTGDYTVTITTDGFSSSAIYGLCDIPIVSMNYYSAVADSFDEKAGDFGVIYGNLSETLRPEALEKPMGAGPYTVDEWKDGTLLLKRNEHYWRGMPEIETVSLVPVSAMETAAKVAAGEVDCGSIVAGKAMLETIAEENGGEISGTTITTLFVDHFAYGYIGINAESVSVNGDPSGEASLYLRRALATVIGAFRSQANRNYFGEAALTAEYPLSGSGWAAPQPGEEDYREAYSVDLHGNAIYTPEMTQAQRENAALKAALEYLEAAGFTIVGGVVVEGPSAPAAEAGN